jgi:hypothetical protein
LLPLEAVRKRNKGQKKMHVEVIGKPNGVSHKEYCYIARWMGRTLMQDATFDKVDVEIELHQTLKDYANMIPIERYTFKINMNVGRLRPNTQIRALCHEMIHVWQTATGKYFQYKNGIDVRWASKIFNTKETDYFDQPWEREALDLEKPLYRLLKSHLKCESDRIK